MERNTNSPCDARDCSEWRNSNFRAQWSLRPSGSVSSSGGLGDGGEGGGEEGLTIPEPRDEIFVNLYDYMPHPRVTLCASSCVFSAALHERIRARLASARCMRARHTRTLDSLEALHASLLHHKVKRVNSRCPAQAHVQSDLHGASKMPQDCPGSSRLPPRHVQSRPRCPWVASSRLQDNSRTPPTARGRQIQAT